jgi:serine/threonine protein kinase
MIGRVSEQEARRLERHVLACEKCGKAIETLAPQDTLVEAIRSQDADPEDPEEEKVKELVERVSRLGPHVPVGGDSTPWAAQVDGLENLSEEAYGFLGPPESPGEIGRLGPYRILKVLGVGGMGVVFQAEDTQLKRLVALKGMRPALAASVGARQRFLREARAVAALEHDHIVPIYQVGEERGVPYLAMQRLEGESLADRLLREGKLGLGDVLRIGKEIANGLSAAHQRGLIHRDIKPANVWLEAERDRVEILDFGLARAADDNRQVTQIGPFAGP